ncbi:hypothetical protein D1007_12451 [Hordeum vulgare]|nr:hypothetical protein D1007_12451 [Hordeum vulgare]
MPLIHVQNLHHITYAIRVYVQLLYIQTKEMQYTYTLQPELCMRRAFTSIQHHSNTVTAQDSETWRHFHHPRAIHHSPDRSIREGKKRGRWLRSARRPTGGSLVVHEHLDELLALDAALAAGVGLADKLVGLLLRQPVAVGQHHLPQLLRGDDAAPVVVEGVEALGQALGRHAGAGLARRHGQERGEVDGGGARARARVLEEAPRLGLVHVLAQRAERRDQLARGDAAVLVAVEQVEHLLALVRLLPGQLGRHGRARAKLLEGSWVGSGLIDWPNSCPGCS